MVRKLSWLDASRYGWFVIVGAVLVGKDACIGGNKRPDPVTPPSPASASATGTAAPPATPPLPSVQPVG